MAAATPYIVSARKYRPATFSSVIGQKALTSTLKNSITSGKLAQAYLFCGPRGVGKTSCARIFAKTINCLNPTPDGEACCECESCLAIDRGTSYNLIELDAASNNGVDDIRAITEQVQVPPQVGRYRVFIIDEVHMLSNQAFNAFLKTLEEPPAYAIFILATTEKHKVIPTILSRCQIYDFKRITIDDTVDHLKYVAKDKGITADSKALEIIARKADGAMRDALSIFDQVSAASGGNITYESALENLNILDYEYFFRLVDAFAKGDVAGSLLIYNDVRLKGFDSLSFIGGLASHVRDLMMAADPRTQSLMELPQDTAARFTVQAKSLPLQWYYAALKILNDCDFNYRTASNKQLLVEVTLIRLCQLMAPADPPFRGGTTNPPLHNPATGPQVVAQPSAPPAAPRPSATVTTPVSSPDPIPASPPPTAPQAPGPVTPTPTSASPATPASPDSRPTPQTPQRPVAGRPKSFRLTEEVTSSTGHLEPRRNPVTIEDIQRAWQQFMVSNPDQRILMSAMRGAKLQMTGEADITALVRHPAEQQAFESSNKLITFLRDTLRNDFISIRAEVDKSVEVHNFLPPEEFLQKAIANTPGLADLLRDYQGEID